MKKNQPKRPTTRKESNISMNTRISIAAGKLSLIGNHSDEIPPISKSSSPNRINLILEIVSCGLYVDHVPIYPCE